jgi:hypothetical protein
MNIETLHGKLKALIERITECVEHQPRMSEEQRETLPNTALYRLVVTGTGKQGVAGLSRYADFGAVIVRPLSGGDANKSNLDSAIGAEVLVSALADFSETDTLVSEEIESEITREMGRAVVSIAFRVAYKLT